MSTIQLDVSEIQSLKKRISKMIDEIDDCYREVNKISNQIDMKVKRRKDIDADLLQIKNDLKKQKEFLTQCEKLVGESINDFVEAEKIDHLPDLNFSVRSVGGSSNYKVNKAFANLLLGTGFVSLATLMKFFMRAKKVPDVVKIADYPSISEYINEKFPNLKNNGSTVVSAATVEEKEHGGSGKSFDDNVKVSNKEESTNDKQENSQVSNEEYVSNLKQEIQDRYNRLYSKRGKSYHYKCGAFVFQQLEDMGVVKDGEGIGSGKDYCAVWSDRGKTSTGYSIESHSGSTGLDALIEAHSGEPIKNVAVSFEGGKWSDKHGHVVLISEIRDGKVYFMESYDQTISKTTYAEGQPIEITIDEFKKKYKVDSTCNGVTHFYK